MVANHAAHVSPPPSPSKDCALPRQTAKARLPVLEEKEADGQPASTTPHPSAAGSPGSSSSSCPGTSVAALHRTSECLRPQRAQLWLQLLLDLASSDWLMENRAALLAAIMTSGYWLSQVGNGPAQAATVLLPAQLLLFLIRGWPSSRRLLESEAATSSAPRVWFTIPPPLSARTLPVSYETVDRLQQPEAFEVISSHFKRMWKTYPGELFGCAAGHAGGVFSAPAVVWILRVHNDFCHRRYLQQMAAVANRRRLSAAREADTGASIADDANEQRCFKGTRWHCGSLYDAARLGRLFTACGHPLCSLCSVTCGSLNLDSGKSWGALGHCHTVSAHSSRAHCDAVSTHSGGLQAMVMVRAALGSIYQLDDRADPSCVRHCTAPPAGCDSVIADFQNGQQAHPVDDPTVAVYNSHALYASYVIVYSPTVSRP